MVLGRFGEIRYDSNEILAFESNFFSVKSRVYERLYLFQIEIQHARRAA